MAEISVGPRIFHTRAAASLTVSYEAVSYSPNHHPVAALPLRSEVALRKNSTGSAALHFSFRPFLDGRTMERFASEENEFFRFGNVVEDGKTLPKGVCVCV